MLSYVLPVEDKPPPIVAKTHLQLNLDLEKDADGGKTSPLRAATLNGSHIMAPTTIQNFISIEQTQGAYANGGGGAAAIKKIIKTHPKPNPALPALSTESSASSLSSKASEGGGATPTSADKLKTKQNGAKTTSLKRVSFGSSKGSMVETLIYESPLQEESEVATPTVEITPPFPPEGDSSGNSDSKKVRVSFFESERPHVVHSPEPGDAIFDVLDASNVMTSVSPTGIHTPQYQRQASEDKCSDDTGTEVIIEVPGRRDDELERQNARMAATTTTTTSTTSHGGFLYYVVKVPKDGESGRTDSGWDNPFRPDGDLSREADEIVGLIKEGKPITPTSGNGAVKRTDELDAVAAVQSKPLAASPQKGSNGAAGNCEKSGVVEVQRTIVSPSGGGDVEPVVIKKKPKCKCCVIQ